MPIPTLDPTKTREAIYDSGLTITTAASRAGLSQSHLSNVLLGRKRISPPAAARLAALLGTTIPALRAKPTDAAA